MGTVCGYLMKNSNCGFSQAWGRFVPMGNPRSGPRPGPGDADRHVPTFGPHGGLILGGTARFDADSAPGLQASSANKRDTRRLGLQGRHVTAGCHGQAAGKRR